MSVNKYQPHVYVIPEDDANRQLANGFALEVQHIRQLKLLSPAGGWLSLCEKFRSEHIVEMRRFPQRHVVLLLDFDDQSDRRDRVMKDVPDDIKNRVFVLGAKSEPEALKQAGLGHFEEIGIQLALECRDGIIDLWSHDLLQHNASEIVRLRETVREILF